MKQNNVFRHILGWLLLFILGMGAGPVFAVDISGTVYDNTGTIPITGGYIDFYTITGPDPCPPNTLNYIDSAFVNPDGSYAITGLPDGSYYLKAFSSGNHVPEWSAGAASTPDCAGAVAVSVTTTAVNFQLDAGATISGVMYDSSGTSPVIDGGVVDVYADPGTPCARTGYVGSFLVNTITGSYMVTGLPAGNYYLKAFSNGNHIPEWWAGSVSTSDCLGALAVPVGAGGAVSGIDFQLDIGATISGTVTDSAVTPNPVTDGYVEAYTGDACGIYSFVGVSSLDVNGNYSITGLLAGDYLMRVIPAGNYGSEWWASPLSTPDCLLAQKVTVAAGGTASGKNFQLAAGAIISGTVFESDGITPITSGGSVVASTGADPCAGTYATSGVINPAGGYTINGLQAGTYYLKIYPIDKHVSEWWASPLSTPVCSGAEPVTVVAATDVFTGRDFQLELGVMVTTSVVPAAGGTVTGGGTYTAGDSTILTATAAIGYDFTGWSGGVTSTTNPLPLTVSSDITIVANFTPKSYTVTTSQNPLVGGSVTGDGPYFYGATAILTAIPAPGYAFIGWSGDATGTVNPLGISVYSAKNITANFALTYTVTTSVVPIGGGGVTGGGIYTSGTTATLTATPAAGFVFTGWSGDAAGSANPLLVTSISANQTIIANFTPTYTVMVLANIAAGGTVTGGGVYTSGTTATLTATPATGYAFIGWSGDATGTANPLVVTVTSNSNVIAVFAPTYMVTTSAIPAAGGTVTVGGVYVLGDIATLTATPAPGYVFTGWSGDATGKTNPLSINVDSAKNIIANFAIKKRISFPVRATDGTTVIIFM
jgi:uncharacterized repeat protein (TIGR02543 family)